MLRTTARRYYRIDRREIHFLRFILEGYDGAAVLRTIDPQLGIILLYIGPGCQSIVEMIIRDLQRQVRIDPVEDIKSITIHGEVSTQEKPLFI